MHAFLLHNGEIHPTSEKLVSPGKVGYLNGWGVFSTIQVAGGVLFAYERHWARMRRDALLLNVPFPEEPDDLRAQLLALVEANQAYDATLRVAVVRNRGGLFEGDQIGRDYDVVAFTTGLTEWGAGVRLAVQRQARHSGCPFAGTKILSWSFNLAWLEEARKRGFDEVILLNERDEVSECTSANLFVARDGEVRTPPLDSGCLPGITREILLELAGSAGIAAREQPLRLADLYKADAVFITSTTRGLLPVVAIEDTDISHDESARGPLAAAFARYLSAYVADARRQGQGVTVRS